KRAVLGAQTGTRTFLGRRSRRAWQARLPPTLNFSRCARERPQTIRAANPQVLAKEKATLMQKLGKRQLTLTLQEPMNDLPQALAAWPLSLKGQGHELEYAFDANDTKADIPALLRRLAELGIGFKDLNTRESSLEDIFVNLVQARNGASA
ncbi:MAG TPA: hypothetical protein VIV60_12490, partial [Polyangiaceae bacterium]